MSVSLAAKKLGKGANGMVQHSRRELEWLKEETEAEEMMRANTED